MQRLDKPAWKIGIEALGTAVAMAMAVAGLEWIVFEAEGMEIASRVLGVEILLLVALFWPLAYLFFRQKAFVARIEREQEEAKLRDETTKLYKGKVFKELAGTQIRMCKRNNWPVGMIVMDIDRLGKINDSYGYEAGNHALKHFACVVKETIRESDLVARLDDDRFLLLLPNCDAKDAKKIIQRIQASILSEPLQVEKEKIKIPFSSGVVSFAGKIAKYNLMVNRASEALDKAKERGGNRIELF